MDAYKPYQSLTFVYNTNDQKIYIESDTLVLLNDKNGEDLSASDPSGVKPSFSRSLMIVEGAAPENPVSSKKRTEIITNVVTPAGEDDEMYAREKIVEDLYNLRASYYSMKATVIKLDGKKEPTTSVIYQNGNIIIE